MIENVSQRTQTIGTSSSVVSEEQFNSQRMFLSIVNTSTGGQNITIAFGQEATTLQGVVLYPGGFYSESADGINFPTNKQICAVSSGAGGTIAISERITVRSL